MRFKSLIIISLALLIVSSGGYAQKWKLKRYEAIIGVGTANYFGDIGGSADESNLFGLKDIEIFSTRPSVYLGVRYKIRQNMAVKTNFIIGFISGNDEGSKNNDRNYAFNSIIFEPSAQFEYSILSEEQRYRSLAMFNRRGMMNNYSNINVYVFAGIGGIFYWPEPSDELIGSPNYTPDYSTFGLALPMGLGLKYVLSGNWSVGVELGGRLTTTDYLDAYTTQFSKHNDVYYFGVINVIYRIKTNRRGYPVIGHRGGRSFL